MSVADLIEKFRGVAIERVEKMGGLLVSLEREVDPGQIEELTREIHTLKGEAKMMGFADVNLVSHLTEHLILVAAGREFEGVETDLQDLMYEGLDILKALMTKTSGAATAPIDLAGFVDRVAEARAVAMGGTGFGERTYTPKKKVRALSHVEPSKPAAASSLRVGVEKVERLAEASGEVLLASRRLEYQMGRADDVAVQFKRLRDAIEPFLPKSRMAELRQFGRGFDQLVSGLRGAAGQSGQWAMQLESHARDLRHIPLEQMILQYPRAVRDLASVRGKKARFEHDVTGVEVDRGVMNGLADPLLHLVRNAVDHGIETPQERVAAGKPEEGVVRLTADASGDSVRVTLSDDGAGIRPEFIARRAVERELISPEEAAKLSDADKLALIFEAGFSTREEVTDVSGRGIGMDVVRRHVGLIGGTVDIESEPGVGTTFVLDLPVDTSIASVLVVRVGEQRLALPAKDIERVELTKYEWLELQDDALHVPFGEQVVPLIEWGRVLGPRTPPTPHGDLTVLLVRRGARSVAVWVSEVVGEHEAMTRPLGAFLSGVRVCRGICITDAGELVPVLNVNELLSAENFAQAPNIRARATANLPAVPKVHTILVVEDSEVTRALVSSLLTGAGFRVVTAEDGYDGWQKLQGTQVSLVLSDVQMPRMSGLSLLEKIKGDERFAELPVVMLTTLGEAADKARAMNLGADGYLVKLNFQEKELLQTVRRFLS